MANSTQPKIKKEEAYRHKEIIYTVARLYNVISGDISNYLKNFGLTIGKLNILIAIRDYGHEEGLRQVEVSQYLIVSPSNMTKMIDKLEKDGLVERSALEGDRRVNMVKVTKKSIRLLDSLWAGYEEKLKEAVGSLNKSQQKQLAGLLTEWFESIQ